MKNDALDLPSHLINFEFSLSSWVNLKRKYRGEVNDESEEVMRIAKKLGVKIAWVTDLFGALPKQALQPLEFTARQKYFSNFEILRQATPGNAELFTLSGKHQPYQEGELGVIKQGAYADLLLIDGNPLENLELITDSEQNLRIIMKDGVSYKNSLD